jgi:putative phage-type endonuclease
MNETERAKWLDARRKGIGGSDAAKVLGISQWGGPFSVFMDKTGRKPDREMTEAMEMGIELEETVARLFCKRTGLKVARVNRLLRHPEHPWMIANVDRRIIGTKKGLECKTAHFIKTSQWDDDELPDDYYCQTQHYCAVTGWNSCWIASLIGGQKFIYKEVPRNEEFIRAMIAREREFWHEYVLQDIAPPVNAFDDVTEFYPENYEDEIIQPTDRHLEILERIFSSEDEARNIDETVTALKNQLRQDIGDKIGIDGVATWKNNRPSQKVNWEGIAQELGATPEVISRYTAMKPGARVLRLARKVHRTNREAA